MDIVKPGASAPDFNFKDINGKSISMNDLKGKYIYIDVWATWCGPCIREIPASKKMEKLYRDKNIEFVYISIDVRDRPVYNYDKWKEMIEEKSLGGVQLFADNGQRCVLGYGCMYDGSGTVQYNVTFRKFAVNSTLLFIVSNILFKFFHPCLFVKNKKKSRKK